MNSLPDPDFETQPYQTSVSVEEDFVKLIVGMADDIIQTMMMEGPGATPPLALALAHTIKNQFDG